MIEAIFAVLTSGAGGGIIGAFTGLWNKAGERKERIAMANIESAREETRLARDKVEAEERQKERDHILEHAKLSGSIDLEKSQSESEASIELANMTALGDAQSAFNNLNTSTKMDDLRGSVRPVFAYYLMAAFSGALAWFALTFSDQITPEVGGDILMKLILTLIFMVTSMTSFYYVSRRNSKP